MLPLRVLFISTLLLATTCSIAQLSPADQAILDQRESRTLYVLAPARLTYEKIAVAARTCYPNEVVKFDYFSERSMGRVYMSLRDITLFMVEVRSTQHGSEIDVDFPKGRTIFFLISDKPQPPE